MITEIIRMVINVLSCIIPKTEVQMNTHCTMPSSKKKYADSAGVIHRKYDKNSNKTTLIDDEVRVYKGGSWRDGDYWLDPAQRRFLPQYMATDYIGFRCAMSRIGSKTIKKKKARR